MSLQICTMVIFPILQLRHFPALQVIVGADFFTRVKSGNFGHQANFDIHFANSGNPDEPALREPSHQDLQCLLCLLIFCTNN